MSAYTVSFKSNVTEAFQIYVYSFPTIPFQGIDYSDPSKLYAPKTVTPSTSNFAVITPNNYIVVNIWTANSNSSSPDSWFVISKNTIISENSGLFYLNNLSYTDSGLTFIVNDTGFWARYKWLWIMLAGIIVFGLLILCMIYFIKFLKTRHS